MAGLNDQNEKRETSIANSPRQFLVDSRQVVQRIGLLSRWCLWFLVPIFLISTSYSCGVRRPGFLLGFRDGAIAYENAYLPARTRKPPKPLTFYLGDPTARGTLGHWVYTTKGNRWKQVIFPLWIPLLIAMGGSILGPRRFVQCVPGPHRMTIRRFVGGLIRYWIVVAVISIFMYLLTEGHCLDRVRTFFAVYPIACWFASPFGAWTCANAAIERANQTASPTLCWTCGYDLTGNVTGVCSECGTTLHPNQVRPVLETATKLPENNRIPTEPNETSAARSARPRA